MKYPCVFIVLWTYCTNAFCQDAPSYTEQAVQSYYRQALQYKDGSGVPMDYAKAVYYFGLAAERGDAQSIYALAYMKYKGLGCGQDYEGAAAMFRQGAFQGRDNSMYFYALCWRNGYGLLKNEDSAVYWLRKDSVLGYRQAVQELAMKTPENGNGAAKALVASISNAALPARTSPNRFQRIYNRQPPSGLVAGTYTGYLVQYDWSGQEVVSSKTLRLSLVQDGMGLQGTWAEEGSDSVPLEALFVNDSLRFSRTKYKRKDHYSPDSAIGYEFRGASLNLVQKGDTVFLAGNVGMFSAVRGEPSKPLLVALWRVNGAPAENAPSFSASPSPYSSVLNVGFTLPSSSNVEVQLIGANGQVAYRNGAGTLPAGHYTLPLQAGYLAPGVYTVRLLYGRRSMALKVVKD